MIIIGDNVATVQAIVRQLNTDEVHANVLPEGKMLIVEAARKDAMRVAFVGDGINDAPALATDVVIETASVVLMRDTLMGVVQAVALSRTTLRNIK